MVRKVTNAGPFRVEAAVEFSAQTRDIPRVRPLLNVAVVPCTEL